MISFEDYVELYHSNVKDETELNHIKVEFEEHINLVSKLDKSRDYSEEELCDILFGDGIKSQTTFYRRRRGITRIATIEGFNFRIIHKINKISFEDIYDTGPFANEYFASLDELLNEIKTIQKSNTDYDRTGAMVVAGLLWSGLTFAELTRLKDSDINLSNKSVNVNNREIKICNEVSKAIRDYISWRKGGGEFLFTGANGVKAHKTTINKMLTKLNGYTNKTFISKNITYSGWFYRIYNGIELANFKSKDLEMKYKLWVKIFYNT